MKSPAILAKDKERIVKHKELKVHLMAESGGELHALWVACREQVREAQHSLLKKVEATPIDIDFTIVYASQNKLQLVVNLSMFP